MNWIIWIYTIAGMVAGVIFCLALVSLFRHLMWKDMAKRVHARKLEALYRHRSCQSMKNFWLLVVIGSAFFGFGLILFLK